MDWSAPFAASDRAAWEAEYDACVEPEELPFEEAFGRLGADWALDGRFDWTGYLAEEAAHDCGE